MNVKPLIQCDPGEIFSYRDGFCYTAAVVAPTISCPNDFEEDVKNSQCVRTLEKLPLNGDLIEDNLFIYEDTVFSCPKDYSYDITSQACLRRFYVDFSESCEKDFIMQNGECVAVFVARALCSDGSIPSAEGNCPVWESKPAKAKCPKGWEYDEAKLECWKDSFTEPATTCDSGSVLTQLTQHESKLVCRQVIEYPPIVVIEDVLNKKGQTTGKVKETVSCANGGQKKGKTCMLVIDSDVLLSCPAGLFLTGQKCVTQARTKAEVSCVGHDWIPSFLPNAAFCYKKYFEKPFLCPSKYELSVADMICVRITIRPTVKFCPTGYYAHNQKKCVRDELIKPSITCRTKHWTLVHEDKTNKARCRKLDSQRAKPYLNFLKCELGWEMDWEELMCTAREVRDKTERICPAGFQLTSLESLNLPDVENTELKRINSMDGYRRLRAMPSADRKSISHEESYQKRSSIGMRADEISSESKSVDEDEDALIVLKHFESKFRETSDTRWKEKIDKFKDKILQNHLLTVGDKEFTKNRRLQEMSKNDPICVSPNEKRTPVKIICSDGYAPIGSVTDLNQGVSCEKI